MSMSIVMCRCGARTVHTYNPLFTYGVCTIFGDKMCFDLTLRLKVFELESGQWAFTF